MQATIELTQVNWDEESFCYVASILVTIEGHYMTGGFDCNGYADTRVGAMQEAGLRMAEAIAQAYLEQEEYEQSKN